MAGGFSQIEKNEQDVQLRTDLRETATVPDVVQGRHKPLVLNGFLALVAGGQQLRTHYLLLHFYLFEKMTR